MRRLLFLVSVYLVSILLCCVQLLVTGDYDSVMSSCCNTLVPATITLILPEYVNYFYSNNRYDSFWLAVTMLFTVLYLMIYVVYLLLSLLSDSSSLTQATEILIMIFTLIMVCSHKRTFWR